MALEDITFDEEGVISELLPGSLGSISGIVYESVDGIYEISLEFGSATEERVIIATS